MKSLETFSRETISKLLKAVSERDGRIDSLVSSYEELEKDRNGQIEDYNNLVDKYNDLVHKRKELYDVSRENKRLHSELETANKFLALNKPLITREQLYHPFFGAKRNKIACRLSETKML